MNTLSFFRSRLLILFAAFTLVCAPIALNAQQFSQAANNTTTNGAITAAATTVVLTSASAIAGSSFGAPAAGQCIYFADGNTITGANNSAGELARIASIASTTVTLTRTAPVAHATSTRVFTAACSFFQTVDPPPGSCTASASPLPWINTRNGNVGRCMGTSGWNIANATVITFNSSPGGLPW